MSGVKMDHTGQSAMFKLQEKHKNKFMRLFWCLKQFYFLLHLYEKMKDLTEILFM